MSEQFHKLTVSKLEKPIKDAVRISFTLPKHLIKEFSYHPGQHLLIEFEIEGESYRRTYSLNSCPFLEEDLQISIKRVKAGKVSNFANDQLKEGDTLKVMKPKGRFFAQITAEAYKSYYLFAAGSGITPIFSILKSILVASPYSQVYLFYGNKNQDSILFNEELKSLQAEYKQRLEIVHILSNPGLWSSWESWKGKKGRINSREIEDFINHHPPIAQQTEYFICGPSSMNLDVRKSLMELGIPADLIHIEHFSANQDEGIRKIDSVDHANIELSYQKNSFHFEMKKGQTILQGLKENGIEVPYSCESGVCGSCVAKLREGSAEMKTCMALDDKDIEEGYILNCQALATSERLKIEIP
ncbi:MAG: 2Fe-2S iron-sulfur cluster-binding protein [Bacteroidia bacterium]|nr:2Fe-2S iron-sulfur cluster-binding protein [Bacteroidia bacterium]